MIIPDLILARDAAIGLTAGLLAGLVHFSSLWWNTRLLMSKRAGKTVLLQLARFAVAAGTLAILAWFGTVALLADWMWRSFFWTQGGRRDRDRGGAGAIVAVIAIALAVLTPVIAVLIQLGVSRPREYLADASGALLTRYPPGLASALRKIAADKEPLEVANKATASLYIANPLKDAPAFFDHLFDTHPPIEERIKRLEAMN